MVDIEYIAKRIEVVVSVFRSKYHLRQHDADSREPWENSKGRRRKFWE